MAAWLQWIIATSLTVLGIFIGRYWGFHDNKRKIDQELLDKIKQTLPSDSTTITYLLKQHDFRGGFNNNLLDPINSLINLFDQPENYFLDKKLEKLRLNLKENISSFLELVSKYVFYSDATSKVSLISSVEEILLGWSHRMEYEEKSLSDDEIKAAYNKAFEQFKSTADELNLAATEILKSYNELLRKSHQIIIPILK